MSIAALVSGGVDSSVMLHILNETSEKPVIFYIKISMEDEMGQLDDCNFRDDLQIVAQLAKKYGCKFEIADLHTDYWNTVVQYTIETVKKGLTPNPDIMCNKMIKFGIFDTNFGTNFDYLCTGHYATTTKLNSKTYLSTAKDRFKDQTYFLSALNSKQISRIGFPIGHLLKKEVREIAHQQNLPSASRPDSQGICFLGKINYSDFLKRYLGEKEGLIVEAESGKIWGKHQGYWFYTIGQRHGLKLGQGPWYVVGKHTPDNTIFISKNIDNELFRDSTIFLDDFNYINEIPDGLNFSSIKFKIRHSPEFNAGTIKISNNKAVIHSEISLSGVAPGQFAVVYDKDEKYCLASGIISNKETINN